MNGNSVCVTCHALAMEGEHVTIRLGKTAESSACPRTSVRSLVHRRLVLLVISSRSYPTRFMMVCAVRDIPGVIQCIAMEPNKNELLSYRTHS